MKFKRLALFISGKGSNARNIMEYFQHHESISVSFVFSTADNPEMREVCLEKGVAFEHAGRFNPGDYLSICRTYQIDWVILAGFLKKIPDELIAEFPNRIINIHPSLLPNFGGKGMYGTHVHKAVADAASPFSGISIHFVNEEFDKGKLLAQFAVPLPKYCSSEQIEQEVRRLEIKYFPVVIEDVIRNFTTE